MVEKRFEKLGMPDIERFENYLPTAFNSELTLLQKVNKIIFDLIESNKLTNEMIDYLNKFIEKFDEKLYKTIEDVLQVWLDDGLLAEVVREAINEEVVEARESETITYENLKERLDVENNQLKILINENNTQLNLFTDVFSTNKNRVLTGRLGGAIRSIFNDPINDLMYKVSNLNKSNFNFGFITDVHYEQGGAYWGPIGETETGLSHLKNIGLFSKYMNFVMCGGDNIDIADGFGKYNAYNNNNNFVANALQEIECDVFFGIGNHDDNNIVEVYNKTEPFKSKNTDQSKIVLTDKDFEILYYQEEKLFNEKRDNNSNYFYKDYANNKVRMIWIDVYNNPYELDGLLLKYPRNKFSMVSEQQIKWLAENAFNVPSDEWQIVIATHCPLDKIFNTNANTCINHDKVVQLIEAYKNKTTFLYNGVGYTFKSDKIIGVFSGHYHDDRYKKLNGVNYVVADCSLGGAKTEKYFGTPMEDSWKFISVNTTNRNVEVIGFGRGDSHNFTY